MTRRQRLMATLEGKPVDRPAVCFYEINGLDQDPDDPNPFNVFNDPSWRPLIELARDRSDRIVMRGVAYKSVTPDPLASTARSETAMVGSSEVTTRTFQSGGRTLTTRTRRDPEINTIWTVEHLLKDTDDLRAFLETPAAPADGVVDPAPVTQTEAVIGETGIVMIDTPDPLCLAAGLFDMSDYLIIALTERALFRRLLEHYAEPLLARTEAIAKAAPGRLWRIYGPEFASPPYLPPALFDEYVCTYVRPMVASIQRYGGFARVHSHGRLAGILDLIAGMGPAGLDPIEPPPQGDIELAEVRRRIGADTVLFGNIEASDLENLPTDEFALKVRRALDEGQAGSGRGFVLMPSSCPAGRLITPQTLRNYETMVEMAEAG